VRGRAGLAAADAGDGGREAAEHLRGELPAGYPEPAERGPMVEHDNAGGAEHEQLPRPGHGPPRPRRQGGELQPQLLGVEPHVPFLIGQDPPRYLRRQRVPGPVAKRPVVAQRDELGDEQHHQLQAEPERPAEPDEDGVGPVAGDERGVHDRQQGGQQSRVVLLLGDEQPHGPGVALVPAQAGLGGQVRAVAGLTELEPLQAPHESRIQGGAACPVRVTVGSSLPRRRLEIGDPIRELACSQGDLPPLCPLLTLQRHGLPARRCRRGSGTGRAGAGTVSSYLPA